MKSVSKIFEKDEEAKEFAEVKELISEYENLQDEYYDLELLKKRVDKKSDLFKELLRDIQNSIKMQFEQEKENEKLNLSEAIDYKKSLENLHQYIKDFCYDNRIYL